MFMRMATLEQEFPYLAARGDDSGSFVQWLDVLKVSRHSGLTIANMIRWGWIRPIARVVIPNRYFKTWQNYPVLPDKKYHHDDDAWADALWQFAGSSKGFVFWEKSLRGEWFVHPFDRRNSLEKRLTAAKRLKELQKVAEKRMRGHLRYSPWIDYFPHWKGYELIDVLRVAKLIGGVWCTSDTKAILRGLLRDHDRLRRQCLPWIERETRAWLKRGRFFEPLSRYRAMRSAINSADSRLHRAIPFQPWTVPDAGRALAKRLRIPVELLEKDGMRGLLELAKEWHRWKETDGVGPGQHAFGHLQKDITLTVEWLHTLTGNTLEHYYDAWSGGGREPRSVLTLEEALPQEARTAESYFLDHFIRVRGAYEKLPDPVRLTDAEVAQVVRALHKKTFLTTDWLLNYKRLHIALRGAPDWDWAGVSENTIILDFTLLALFAEKILEKMSPQPGWDPKPLVGHFCRLLEAKDPRFTGAWNLAAPLWKDHTYLRKQPPDPFGTVMRLSLNGSPAAAELARALLMFGLTRNYFGHQSYLDDKLIQTPEGGAALGGVVTTLLYLAAVPCGIR